MYLKPQVQLTPHACQSPRSHNISMGHFSLTKKKVNGKIEAIFTNSSNAVTIFKFGFSQRSMSRDPDRKSSQNASPKPILSIETNVVSNITPPLSPSESPPSGKRSSTGSHNRSQEKRTSTRNMIRSISSTTPPQSPASKSPPSAKPYPRKSFGSLTLFRTPRQRKLQEIREGKLPAISNPECGRTSTSSSKSSETDPILTEIYDPSSSTTYNPRTQSKKQSSKGTNHQKVVTTLPSTVTTTQMLF